MQAETFDLKQNEEWKYRENVQIIWNVILQMRP